MKRPSKPRSRPPSRYVTETVQLAKFQRVPVRRVTDRVTGKTWFSL